MDKLLITLRVGEKIAFGYAVLGAFFLSVIWFNQHTLSQSLTDYDSLLKVHTANKDHLMASETYLLLARQFEARYIQQRKDEFANQVVKNLDLAKREVAGLLDTDKNNNAIVKRIQEELNIYENTFSAVRSAWVKKGVDEDSGLQGSFRDAVHDLQDMASNLDTDNIYLTLLQIRRSEKDLGLRRQAEYRQRVDGLLERLESEIQDSLLLDEVKKQLLTETTVYREEFARYAEKVLAGEAIDGGKGPFRDSAHRLENLIKQYYVPDLERDILQLRRREKDYLLRGDKKYVEMALNHISLIQQRIEQSSISPGERTRFETLLQRYHDDFLALVDQNGEIDSFTRQMEQSAHRVTELVNQNVQSANSAMAEMASHIKLRVEERTLLMFWAIVAALGLGALFSIKTTRLIVNPIHKMTDVLETLTHTELVSPIRHIEGGRDEVNNMAGFINTLVEHRNKFINWWRNSMDQEEACSQLRAILKQDTEYDPKAATEIAALRSELNNSLGEKKRLIAQEVDEVGRQSNNIINSSSILLHPSIGRADVDEQARKIQQSAELINKHLEMLSR